MYKNKLQELCQKNSYPLPEYQTTHEGPLHNPLFLSTVTVKSITFTSKEPARNRKASQDSAAMVAFHHFLQNENNMKNAEHHELVRKSSRNLAGRGGGRRIEIHNVNTMIAGAGPDSSSQQVVEAADDDHMEVEVRNSLKRNRVEHVDKGKNVPVKAVPLQSEGEDLLQLLNVWSDPDPDLKLKIIQDLGTTGRSKTMTEGIIAAVKALEIANKASIEGEVRMDMLVKERDSLVAKVKTLEDTLRLATLPGEEELDNTACLDRPGLVAEVNNLQKCLVDAAAHSFGNAVEQLKVVNPEVELCVDGIHYLKYVENGVLVTPPEEEESEDVENAHA